MSSALETVVLILILLCVCLLLLHLLPRKKRARRALTLLRHQGNPILTPIAEHWWESEAIFNPAALYYNGRIHLFYRALGRDGISRIGYASSEDGVHFDERLPYPVYMSYGSDRINKVRHSGQRAYNPSLYASGGGWGGVEDPRLVVIDEVIYMTLVSFDGWDSLRMALTSIGLEDFDKKQWKWDPLILLSPPGEVHKNWMLFPEKINGKFAILHSISPSIRIAYVDDLSLFDGTVFIEKSARSGGRAQHWDKLVRGAGAPPLRTSFGWLLFYHGFDPAYSHIAYKVGAMLLDIRDPTKILYRSSEPVLEAQTWYENDWKPGVTYASGAVIRGNDLFVYYGGGDKYIAVAQRNLKEFLQLLMVPENRQ